MGLYNGQTANREEANNNSHLVSRLTYPFKLKSGQYLEAGVQAYTGKYTIATSTGNKITSPTFNDSRAAATVVLYPQSFGFQAEYNVGTGPEFDPNLKLTTQQKLRGGYAQVMYRINKPKYDLIPFIKYQYYNGGKKFEIDARRYIVKDLEIGFEYQVKSYFELVMLYMISDRTFEDFAKPINHQKGNTLRIQTQFNF